MIRFLDIIVSSAEAAVGTNVAKTSLPFNNLSEIFGWAINVVLGVGIAITVIFLILGGIQYITARGDQKAAGQARDALTNAVIGFLVVVGAFTIKTVLLNMMGASNTSPNELNEIVPVM